MPPSYLAARLPGCQVARQPGSELARSIWPSISRRRPSWLGGGATLRAGRSHCVRLGGLFADTELVARSRAAGWPENALACQASAERQVQSREAARKRQQVNSAGSRASVVFALNNNIGCRARARAWCHLSPVESGAARRSACRLAGLLAGWRAPKWQQWPAGELRNWRDLYRVLATRNAAVACRLSPVACCVTGRIQASVSACHRRGSGLGLDPLSELRRASPAVAAIQFGRCSRRN